MPVDGDRSDQQGRIHENHVVDILERIGYRGEITRGEMTDFRAKFIGRGIEDIVESGGNEVLFSITSKNRFEREKVRRALTMAKTLGCKPVVVIFSRKTISGIPSEFKRKIKDKKLFLWDSNKLPFLNSRVDLIEGTEGREIKISDKTSLFLSP